MSLRSRIQDLRTYAEVATWTEQSPKSGTRRSSQPIYAATSRIVGIDMLRNHCLRSTVTLSMPSLRVAST
jgi:hypothetical protein